MSHFPPVNVPVTHVKLPLANDTVCVRSKWEEALADGNKCIEVKPDFAKGYSRKAAALFGMRKMQEAASAYEEGLAKFPDDAALKKGLEDVRAEGSRAGANQISEIFKKPEVLAKLATDPSTAGFMKDPQVQQMLVSWWWWSCE